MWALIASDRNPALKKATKVTNCSLCEPSYLDETSQLVGLTAAGILYFVNRNYQHPLTFAIS